MNSLPSTNLYETMYMHINIVVKITGGNIHEPGGGAELLGIKACIVEGRMNKLGIQHCREKGEN
jgi:hypothetical protein